MCAFGTRSRAGWDRCGALAREHKSPAPLPPLITQSSMPAFFRLECIRWILPLARPTENDLRVKKRVATFSFSACYYFSSNWQKGKFVLATIFRSEITGRESWKMWQNVSQCNCDKVTFFKAIFAMNWKLWLTGWNFTRECAWNNTESNKIWRKNLSVTKYLLNKTYYEFYCIRTTSFMIIHNFFSKHTHLWWSSW